MAGGGNGYDPSALGAKFGNKLGDYLGGTAPGLSSTTQAGVTGLSNAANNPTFNNALSGAMGSIGGVAAGNDLGTQDPVFQRNLNRTLSDTQGDVMASLGGTGNLNSDLHVKTLADALGGVRDQAYQGQQQYQDQRQMAAASMLPGLDQASFGPAQAQLAAGQVQDGAADPNFNRFMQLLGGFTGSGSAPGMQQQAPWWQQALGGVATGAGILGSFL